MKGEFMHILILASKPNTQYELDEVVERVYNGSEWEYAVNSSTIYSVFVAYS